MENREEIKTNFRLVVSSMNDLGNNFGVYPFLVEGHFEGYEKKLMVFLNSNEKTLNSKEVYIVPLERKDQFSYLMKQIVEKTYEIYKFKITKLEMYSYITGDTMEMEITRK